MERMENIEPTAKRRRTTRSRRTFKEVLEPGRVMLEPGRVILVVFACMSKNGLTTRHAISLFVLMALRIQLQHTTGLMINVWLQSKTPKTHPFYISSHLFLERRN